MILISHRGNISGREIDRENTIEHIESALSEGYDVEVDVWWHNHRFYLGHDSPDRWFGIDLEFFKRRGIWCHAKNAEALLRLRDSGAHCFSIDVDYATITSKGFLWVSPSNRDLLERSICVMPEDKRWKNLDDLSKCYGICSDNICEYKDMLRGIKLVILDVDGVMTDGKKTYDSGHKVLSKEYNDRDFTAIKRMKKQGIDVCLLSGDKRINESMASGRKIDFIFSRDKETQIDNIKKRYSVEDDEIAYVGDDYFDLGIMKKLFHNFCPENSPKCVRDVAQVLPAKGGDGLVSVFFDEMVERGYFRDEC